MKISLYDSKTYISDLQEAARNTIGMEKLKNTRILITGATGTIGSFLVDMLLQYNKTEQANITVYAAGRSLERLKERFCRVETSDLHYVWYDVLKPLDFDFPIDYIIHAGGNAHPVAFNRDPVGTIVGNINGTYVLLEYGRLHGVKRFCYVSSGEIYGQGDPGLIFFDEEYSGYVDPTSPRSCYPVSKRAAETLCVSYSKQHGVETVIVRPCHTYGPGMTDTDSRAHAQFIRNVLKGEDIVLKSSGSQMRSYCYIADCATAVLTVLLHGNSGEAYNSANPDSQITIAGLAQIIARNAGRKVVFTNPDTGDMANRTPIMKQVLSSDKIEGLGWKGRYTVEKGIAHTLAILHGK